MAENFRCGYTIRIVTKGKCSTRTIRKCTPKCEALLQCPVNRDLVTPSKSRISIAITRCKMRPPSLTTVFKSPLLSRGTDDRTRLSLCWAWNRPQWKQGTVEAQQVTSDGLAKNAAPAALLFTHRNHRNSVAQIVWAFKALSRVRVWFRQAN